MPIYRDEILLQVKDLNAGYGKRQVLFNISLEVKQCEIVLLIGGNGSGKSTLLKSIYRLMPPFENSKEEITFAGENITHSKPFNLLGKGLVYVAQKNNTFDQLTVKENLEIAANNLDMNVVKERIAEILKKLPHLIPFKNITPFNLSGGERQQLALAMALMQNPKMILLDEPSAGLSPVNFLKNLEIIKTLNKSGISFLIIEHRVKEAAVIADRVLALKLGVIDESPFE